MPISEPEAGEVVVVPFPFTDKQAQKRRPTLAISSPSTFPGGHAVLAMITSSKHSAWPLDLPILDLQAAGLSSPSVIRMKIFTLDNRLIQPKAGRLSDEDRGAMSVAVRKLLCGIHPLNPKT